MVNYTIQDEIARISIDDGKANALNPTLFEALGKALDKAEQDKPKLVVISGRPKFFSAGLDLKLLPTLSAEKRKEVLVLFAKTMTRLFMFPIPTAAAITGHAIAGGTIMAFACDKRFFLEGPYRMQLNEIANNMTLPRWMLAITRSRVPARLLTEITLHAKPFTPQQAFDIGIIHGVLSDEKKFVDEVIAQSQELLALSPLCYGITKNRLFGSAIKDALDKLPNERSGQF
jgi:enoyl-CoA hydratase